MPEFSERIFGALISTLPPLPPCEPPVATIELPVWSLKLFPDLSVMVPPELPPAELSPFAMICEFAPRLSWSDATSSMTPFRFCTVSA